MSTDEVPPAEEPKGTNKSPFSGCLLVTIAGLMVLFLIGWSLWTLRYQEGEIAQFTQEEAAPVEVADLTTSQSALQDLEGRINAFGENVQSDSRAELALTAEDLNLAIARYDLLEALRKTFHVEEIADSGLKINISYQLGKSPFSGRTNHLNGVMTAVPELVPGEVILRIKSIDVPEGEMPKEFLSHMEVHRIMEVYKEHPQLGPIMQNLTSLSLADGKVTVIADPAVKPPSDVPEDLNPSIERFMKGIGIIATLFLALVATLLLLARRKKRLNTGE